MGSGVILDTNAYRAYLDGNAEVYAVFAAHTVVHFPLAVIAELRKGFLGGTKRIENEQILQNIMVRAGSEILSPTVVTADHFAELAVFCKKKGRALSDNDLWIAATALEMGEPLLTLDKDFAVFREYAGLDVIVL